MTSKQPPVEPTESVPTLEEARTELEAVGVDVDALGRRGAAFAHALLERNRLRAELACLREAASDVLAALGQSGLGEPLNSARERLAKVLGQENDRG